MENNNDTFKMFIPFELVKGKEICDKNGKKRKMLFKGTASTAEKDLDGETLDPNGFDYSIFMKSGHINWNHQSSKDPLAIIGEPTKAIVKNNKFEIEGFLYEDSELAKKVYKLQDIFEKSSSTRRLGFSIEGNAIERDPLNKKYVKKALIMNVAIAPTPKNLGTSMSLVKAFEYESITSVADNIITDIVHDGERIIMNKAFDILMTKSTAIIVSDTKFKEHVLTIHKAIEAGSVSCDIDEIKQHLSKFRSELDSTVWVLDEND